MELTEVGKGVFAAEHILKSRTRKGITEYLVKWQDWSSKYNSWEPDEHIIDRRLIDSFESEAKAKKWKQKSTGNEKVSQSSPWIASKFQPQMAKRNAPSDDSTLQEDSRETLCDSFQGSRNINYPEIDHGLESTDSKSRRQDNSRPGSTRKDETVTACKQTLPFNLIRKLKDKFLTNKSPTRTKRKPGRPRKYTFANELSSVSSSKPHSAPGGHASFLKHNVHELKLLGHERKRMAGDSEWTPGLIPSDASRTDDTDGKDIDTGISRRKCRRKRRMCRDDGHVGGHGVLDDDVHKIYWEPTPTAKLLLDKVSITDVTTDEFTITVKECSTNEGFFTSS